MSWQGDAVPEPPTEMSIPDETDEGESHSTRAKRRKRRRANLTGTRAGRAEEEPELSLEEQLEAYLRQSCKRAHHRYNSDLGRQNAFQRQIKERDEQIAQLQRQIQEAAPVQQNSTAGGLS